jgi:hypothetical protein
MILSTFSPFVRLWSVHGFLTHFEGLPCGKRVGIPGDSSAGFPAIAAIVMTLSHSIRHARDWVYLRLHVTVDYGFQIFLTSRARLRFHAAGEHPVGKIGERALP